MRWASLLAAWLVCGLGTAAAQLGKPLPKEIEDAWKRAGFGVGWLGPETKDGHFYQRPSLNEFEDNRALPSFEIGTWKGGVVGKLPIPAQPFAMHVHYGPYVSDTSLRELTRFKTLTMLRIGGAHITDKGMELLTAFPDLTALDIHETKVTAAGLLALKPLKKLTFLGLGRNANDTALKNLHEIGLLYALSHAQADGRKRATKMEEVTSFHLIGTYVSGPGLQGLADMPNLTHVSLAVGSVKDSGLKHLAGLKKLSTLNLTRSRVTDAGLKELAPLETLTKLELRGLDITAAGLKELAGLKKLNHLEMDEKKITDDVLKALAEVKLLHALDAAKTADGKRPTKAEEVASFNLRGTWVTAAGLKELAALPNLDTLNLTFTRITADGLKELAGLKKLQTLHLDDKQFTDAGFKGLREANLLHTLAQASDADGNRPTRTADIATMDLRGPRNLTAAALKELADLKQLTTLKLTSYQMTDEAVKNLREIKLLHTLELATTADGKRPKKAEDVTTLDLTGTLTTAASLKELGDFKHLNTLLVKYESISDESLKNLRAVGLLHALILAQPADRTKRPTKADDVATLLLHATKVTLAGLKELEDLKNLTYLDHPVPLSAELFKTMREMGLAHALPQAKSDSVARPKSPAEVVTLELRGLQPTPELFKELKVFKNISTLDVAAQHLTDEVLKQMRAAGLLHTLTNARARNGRPAKAEDVATFDFAGTPATAAALKELADFKSLTSLEWPNERVTDDVVRTLREIGLLHALRHAFDRDGQRPAKAADVARVELQGTKVTAAGLKELAVFTRLATLTLEKERVTDDALKSLSEAGVLHALPQAGTRSSGRPTSAADIEFFNFEETAATEDGLKYLSPLKNLSTLKLPASRVTDVALKNLRAAGLVHALPQATSRGQRPAKADDVDSFYFEKTKLTDAGLKDLAALPQLRYIYINKERVTDDTLKSLREAGLLHALPMAQADGGKLRPAQADEVTRLDLRGTVVSDAGLKELKDLKQLMLVLVDTRLVTDAGVAEVRKALPRCTVAQFNAGR